LQHLGVKPLQEKEAHHLPEASGPTVSVYVPSGLPPVQAWPASCTIYSSASGTPSFVCDVRVKARPRPSASGPWF